MCRFVACRRYESVLAILLVVSFGLFTYMLGLYVAQTGVAADLSLSDLPRSLPQQSPACHETGQWDTSSGVPWWLPSNCTLRRFTPVDVHSCLRNKTVAFFGDSLLLDIFEAVLRLVQEGPSANVSRTRGLYGPGGNIKVSWRGSPGAKLEFWWAPSVFHQQPLQLIPKYWSHLDVAVLGMAVWDMGTYYHGIDAYFAQLLKNLRLLERYSPKVKVILNGLHKLWPDRCHNKSSPCVLCNRADKEELFRTAIREAVACARNSSWQKLGLFSTFGLTNTFRARLDGDDAVHYGQNTSWMQAQVLLNALCQDKRAERLVLEFPAQRGNCMRYSFDQQLQAATGEVKGPCIPDGWRASHN